MLELSPEGHTSLERGTTCWGVLMRALCTLYLVNTCAVGQAQSVPGAPPAQPLDVAAPSLAVPNEGVATRSDLSEDELLRRWLKNSPEVASWRTQIGSARFDVVTARLWPNPELQLLGNFLVAGTPPDAKYNYLAQVTAPMPIFGQLQARSNAAERAVNVAETNVMATLWDRSADVRDAMVDRAFADERVEMLQGNYTELERIRQIVQTRADVGANSQYDVFRVDAAVGTLEASINSATIQRALAESKLLALIADPSLRTAPLKRDGLAAFRGPEDVSKLVDIAIARRPDLMLARRGVVYAQAQAARWKRDAIPTPSVIGAVYAVDKPYGVQVTGGLSIPLPTTDRNQGLIGRAMSEKRGQELLVQALESRVRTEVSAAWQARQDARTALELFRKRSILAATEMLRRAENTYQAGSFSIAQLFDAYQTMWDARSQQLELEQQSAAAEAALERAAVIVPFDAEQLR